MKRLAMALALVACSGPGPSGGKSPDAAVVLGAGASIAFDDLRFGAKHVSGERLMMIGHGVDEVDWIGPGSQERLPDLRVVIT